MSRYAIIPAIALSDTRLSARDITVLCVLGTYADKKGFCYPSVTTIGDLLGIARQSVHRPIKRLIELGYIEKKSRFIPGTGQTSNMYRVLMDYVPPAEFVREAAGGVQPQAAGGAASEAAGGAASEAAGGAASEAALTSQFNVPINDPSEREGCIASEAAPQHSASLIPDDYHPPDTITAQLFRAGRPDVDPFDKTLIAKFISHHQGIGTLSPDWDAKFFNWCLRERKENSNENSQSDTRSRAKRFSDKLDEIALKDIEERNGVPENVG